jgi:acyl carrier protein
MGPEDVVPEARLVDDLALDSLDWADLALRLEETLRVELHDEKLARLATIQDVVDLIDERLRARAGGAA